MIPKIILSNSYLFGDQAVNLIRLHSRGADSVDLKKHAARRGMFEKEISELQPIPGHSVMHVLAVGDEETYGDNRNNDAFSKADNQKCHDRFKKQGHVFQNHKNWSPELKTGHVVATGHNDDMDRIELLIALENAKYAEELAGYERGEDIPVSMGSMQKFDVCSRCGHKAPTAKEHCGHIKEALGEVGDDGIKNYMKNPDPGYFDISTVHKNADRIGFTLRKVASQNGAIGGHDLAEALGVRGYGCPKTATLMRLAEIEKRINGLGKVVPSTAPQKLSDEAAKKLKQKVAAVGTDAVLGHLHSRAQLLSLEDFAEIIVGQSKFAASVKAAEHYLEGGFQRLANDDTDLVSLDGAHHPPLMYLGDDVEQELHEKVAMTPSAVSNRVLRLTIVQNPEVAKVAASTVLPEEAQGLADLYLYYKVAFASHPRNRDNAELISATVLSNILRP